MGRDKKMTDTALISIILPTYNGSKYLRGSVQSCLGQSYKNIELIIVDDGSTDATAEIASGFQKTDNRVRYIRNEMNLKLPATLNRGFEASKGQFLTWTSDDNLFKPEAIEVMHSYLESNPGVGFVYSDVTLIDENRTAIPRAAQIADPDQIFHINCIGPCFMYRREVYEKAGAYNTDLFLVEDYDYWLRIHSYFQMHHLKQSLYLLRQHTGNLGTRFKDEVRLKRAQLREKYISSKALIYFLRAEEDIYYHNDKRKAFSDALVSIASNPFFLGSYRLLAIALLPSAIIEFIRKQKHSIFGEN